jgi:soluble lytic murein transglycosylase
VGWRAAQAQRMLARASASRIALAQARLAIQQGKPTPAPEPAPDPQGAAAVRPPRPHARNHARPALVVTPDMLRDPGYLVDRARSLLRRGQEQRPPRCWPAAPRWPPRA